MPSYLFIPFPLVPPWYFTNTTPSPFAFFAPIFLDFVYLRSWEHNSGKEYVEALITIPWRRYHSMSFSIYHPDENDVGIYK